MWEYRNAVTGERTTCRGEAQSWYRDNGESVECYKSGRLVVVWRYIL